MQDSITIAEVGSIVKVSGSRIATPLGPPSPGSTPTKMPSTSPTIIRTSVFHVSRTAKPCSSSPKASINLFQTFRHCEDQRDEAIQFYSSPFWIASGSLSSGAHSRDPLARNDGGWHFV